MGESIVYALKVALAVAVFVAFSVSVVTILGTVIMFASSTILGEIIGLISIYLPFNPATVFAGLASAITASIGFLVAKKVYETMNNTYQST